MQNSLLKYLELQDFNIEFWIVADESRKRLFESKIALTAFDVIRQRVKFLDYEKLSNTHQREYELRLVGF